MNEKVEADLVKFRDQRAIVNVGALGTVLVLTRKARLKLPLDAASLLTTGGGQVAGLSGRAINKILAEHGVTSSVGTESGRTSRGTPALAQEYAGFLNQLNQEGTVDIVAIEKWWVARFIDYFNTEPFKLNDDQSKTLGAVVRNLLEQAADRQRKASGKAYVGAILQHLVGAKLELALPTVRIDHHGFTVADAVSARAGDFIIDDVVIHCTTTPTPALLVKCKSNLQSGKRPLILTLEKMVGAAEAMAEELGIYGRVEVMDAVQFLAANLYEMSLFNAAQRKIAIEKLAERYNEIVANKESDASLRIEFG